LNLPLIWQADGRPMSGDIGRGTTHAAVRLAQKLLMADLPGYVQLAGGTNQHTVHKLRSLGLLRSPQSSSPTIAGVAYGSYARSLLTPVINRLDPQEDQENHFPSVRAIA
ncbi:MAG: 4Fe-4S ferredoxin, partial [Leptolyngbyaceae cyanobacterium RM2_2_21]|nr:4Fe-4S ferredoxin [Leptolyngbyaceae cyanobacterium RM2_2_21]